jgi:hypothetical protein
MGFVLREGLTFCVSGGRAVFLDVQKDRYFGLPDKLDQAFQKLTLDAPTPRGALAALVKLGVLVEAEGSTSLVCATAETRLLRDISTRASTISGMAAARCLLAQYKAIWLIRRHSFGHVLAQIARLGPVVSTCCNDGLEKWEALALSFRAIAPLRPRSDECLINSVALLQLGASMGLRANLVIGVHSLPFSAHCWVQSGDLILNDRLENIEPFEPILVI